MLAFVHAVGRRHAGFMLAFLACARSGELEDESYFRATLESRPRLMHSGLHVSLFYVELMWLMSESSMLRCSEFHVSFGEI